MKRKSPISLLMQFIRKLLTFKRMIVASLAALVILCIWVKALSPRVSTTADGDKISPASATLDSKSISEEKQISEIGIVASTRTLSPTNDSLAATRPRVRRSKAKLASTRPRPKLISAKKAKLIAEPALPTAHTDRKPASLEPSFVMQIPEPIRKTNDRYREAQLIVEGAGVFAVSSEQSIRGENSPVFATAAVRTKYWYGNDGFEIGGSFRALAMNTAGDEHKPLNLEVRGTHRWLVPFHAASALRELQIGAFGGFEIFRDQASKRFSPGYDLVKLGVTLDLPVFDKWATGGEIGGGYGFDKSTKIDIGGNVKYFFEKTWAIGAGYRAHFFEAGSTSAAPAGLPYREAYGESFLLLQMNY